MSEQNEEAETTKIKQIILDHIKRHFKECNYDGEQLSSYFFLIKKKKMNRDEILRETLEFFGEYIEDAKKFVDWFYDADLETMAKKRLGKQLGPTTKIMVNAVKDVANNAMPKSIAKHYAAPAEPKESLRSEREKPSIKDRIIKNQKTTSDRKELTISPAPRKVMVTESQGRQVPKAVSAAPEPVQKVGKPEVKKPVPHYTASKPQAVAKKLQAASEEEVQKPQKQIPVKAQRSEPVAEEVEDEKTKKKLKRCTFWPQCKNQTTCAFHHPSEQCKKFPKCAFGNQCLYIHPQIECKFKWNCTRPDCAYTHPAPNMRAPFMKQKPFIRKPSTAPKAGDGKAEASEGN